MWIGSKRCLLGGQKTTAKLAFIVAGTVVPNSAFTFTIISTTLNGTPTTDYSGTVHFTGGGAGATLPADIALVSGSRVLTATLATAGNQILTATDTSAASITGVQQIAVAAGPAASFTVSSPSSVNTTQALAVTVTAKDAAGNTATTYNGTVLLTCGDASAIFPGLALKAQAVVSVSGVGVFSTTLYTAGTQTITATDSLAGTLTGHSGGITVTQLFDFMDTYQQADNTALVGGYTMPIGPGYSQVLSNHTPSPAMKTLGKVAVNTGSDGTTSPPGGIAVNVGGSNRIMVVEMPGCASATPGGLAVGISGPGSTSSGGAGVYLFCGYGDTVTLHAEANTTGIDPGGWAGSPDTGSFNGPSYKRISVVTATGSPNTFTFSIETLSSAKANALGTTPFTATVGASGYYGVFTYPGVATKLTFRSVWCAPSSVSFPFYKIPTSGGYYLQPFFVGNGSSNEVLYIGASFVGAAPTVGDGVFYWHIPISYQTSPLYSINTNIGVASGGSGYQVGDTITLAGGVGQAAKLVVSLVSSGAVTIVNILFAGSYSTRPSDAIAQASTSGSGTGATFNATSTNAWKAHITRDCNLYVNNNLPAGAGPILLAHTYGTSDFTYYSTGVDIAYNDGTNNTMNFLYTVPAPTAVPLSGGGSGPCCVCVPGCWFFDVTDPFGHLYDQGDGHGCALHLILVCSSDLGFNGGAIYETHPMSSDFKTWSTPVQITGTNLPTSPVDCCIFWDGAHFNLATRCYKGPFADNITVYQSTSLLSGYAPILTGNWTAKQTAGQWEAPDIRKNAQGTTWIFIADSAPGGVSGSCLNMFTQAVNPASDFTTGSGGSWTGPTTLQVAPTATPRGGRGCFVH